MLCFNLHILVLIKMNQIFLVRKQGFQKANYKRLCNIIMYKLRIMYHSKKMVLEMFFENPEILNKNN